MKKILILTIILGILVTNGIGVASIEVQMQEQTVAEEETELLLGPFSRIRVTVNEIYGDVDDPQYRPLPDVEVMAIGVSYINLGETLYDTTRENGLCIFLAITPGRYMIKASKEGYTDISSGVKQFRMIEAPMASYVDVTFILAEDGSPFVQQNQGSSSSSSSSSSQSQSSGSTSSQSTSGSHPINI